MLNSLPVADYRHRNKIAWMMSWFPLRCSKQHWLDPTFPVGLGWCLWDLALGRGWRILMHPWFNCIPRMLSWTGMPAGFEGHAKALWYGWWGRAAALLYCLGGWYVSEKHPHQGQNTDDPSRPLKRDEKAHWCFVLRCRRSKKWHERAFVEYLKSYQTTNISIDTAVKYLHWTQALKPSSWLAYDSCNCRRDKSTFLQTSGPKKVLLT